MYVSLMFGRFGKSKSDKTTARKARVVHSARCNALHEAMLMNLYCSYGAASAPLFIPSGSLMCTCGEATKSRESGQTVADAHSSAPADLRSLLISA